jgi:hypothetical protein
MEEIINLLKEIREWTRVQGWIIVKDILSNTLEDEVSILIYHHSNGRSSLEIAKEIGVSDQTVRNYWKKWSKIRIGSEMRIVEPISVRGGTRYKKTYLLEDFGIVIPESGRIQD